MIGLYNSENDLVGYFHNNEEIDEYLVLIHNRGVKTNGWYRKDIIYYV